MTTPPNPGERRCLNHPGGNTYQYFGIMGDRFADRGDVRTSDFGRYEDELL